MALESVVIDGDDLIRVTNNLLLELEEMSTKRKIYQTGLERIEAIHFSRDDEGNWSVHVYRDDPDLVAKRR